MRDFLSCLAFKLDSYFNDTHLGPATGFLYHRECDHYVFLVTNRHVVTGRDIQTKKTLHSKAAIPNKLVFKAPTKVFDDRGKITHIRYNKHKINLYKDKDEEHPAWHEHPNSPEGKSFDIVVLPLLKDPERKYITVQDIDSIKDEFELCPGLDTFILGFPKGISVSEHLCIWKRGTVASEPDYPVNNLPIILVDTATRQGMSGAPVIAQINGLWNKEGHSGLGDDTSIGLGRKFIGVYSGRYGENELEAQLGIVWKEHLIQEIVDHLPIL